MWTFLAYDIALYRERAEGESSPLSKLLGKLLIK